jgi:hypothetical protein
VTPRNFYRLAREVGRWLKTYPLKGSQTYGLPSSAIYPGGQSFLPQIASTLPDKLVPIALHKSTPCISIGSCFAEEIPAQMKARGFNYLVNEPNVWNFSADWGRVYTIPNLRQVVDYSLDPDYPVFLQEADGGWFDPLREPPAMLHQTRQDADAAVRSHRAISKATLLEAQVLFVTLGQNECWRDGNFYWGAFPPRDIYPKIKDRIEAVELSLADNVEGLTYCFQTLKAANPALRIVVSVSPVPAFATLCHRDVVETSFYYKCLLRVVAETVARSLPGYVAYFPSFEIVLCRNPTSFTADNRHVQRYVVDRIFDLMLR